MHRSSNAIRWLIRARGVSLARPVAPPPKVSITNHLGVGPLKSEAQGDNDDGEHSYSRPRWIEIASASDQQPDWTRDAPADRQGLSTSEVSS